MPSGWLLDLEAAAKIHIHERKLRRRNLTKDLLVTIVVISLDRSLNFLWLM
jgi:hypothetical protein